MKKQRYLTALIIVATAGAAGAQVRRIPGGRALDASYLVGSGGFNTIRYENRRLDANLYITGQVTGGYYFHGHQPYAGADQLRMNVPSAGQDPFLRGSVGLQQIISGTTYGPVEYLSASRTVVSPQSIAGGLNAPGTSIPKATYLSSNSARKLYDSAIKAYEPIIPDMGRELQLNPLIRPIPIDRQAQGAITPTNQTGDYGAIRPVTSPLYGILRKPFQQKLFEETAAARLARRDTRIARQDQKPLERRVDTQVRTERTEPTLPKTDKTDEKTLEIPPPEYERKEMPKPGQDIFIDLLSIMKKMEEEDKDLTGRDETPGDGTTDAESPRRGPGKFTVKPVIPEKKTDKTGALQKSLPAVRLDRKKIILHSLAGSSRNLFNINMSRAQKMLAEGRYYDAARYCRIARAASPGNPLALILEALSLFAANEPMSSAFCLRQAMKQFPPLMVMKYKVDVNLILGRRIVEKRIVQIEQRVGKNDKLVEPSLVFLAAFIRSSTDQREKAIEHARNLRIRADKEAETVRSLIGKHGPTVEQSGELEKLKLYRAYADGFLNKPAKKTPADKSP